MFLDLSLHHSLRDRAVTRAAVDPGSALNEEMAKWIDEEISQCWASTQGVIRALHRGPVFSEAIRVEDRVRWDVYICIYIYI